MRKRSGNFQFLHFNERGKSERRKTIFFILTKILTSRRSATFSVRFATHAYNARGSRRSVHPDLQHTPPQRLLIFLYFFGGKYFGEYALQSQDELSFVLVEMEILIIGKVR